MRINYRSELDKFNKKFLEDNKDLELLGNKEKAALEYILKDSQWFSSNEKEFVENLNEYMSVNYPTLIKVLIPDEFKEQYAYILDNFINYQYSTSWSRRSFRSKDYAPFITRALGLIESYYYMRFRQTSANEMDKFVTCSDSKYGRELREATTEMFDGYIIAACIDNGDKKVIDVISEMMTCENNINILTVPVIRGIMCSKNEELHDLLCKLLVAAGLSEGLRQAICENADYGTAQAFIKITKTIIDNNLVRFSSVKRALGTWTGLCRDEDPDRLAGKILEDIPYVLKSRENAFAKINTEDPVDIYMGLWGIAFYDINEAFDKINSIVLSDNASHISLLVIGYFCMGLDCHDLTAKIAMKVIGKNLGDYKIFAFFRPFYPYINYFNQYNRMYNNQKKLSLYEQEISEDKELAAKHYDILLEMYNNMPKKEIKYDKILYPWFSCAISKSSLMFGMLGCAMILEDDEKKDFICGHITEIDIDSRSSAIKAIAHKINTKVQRQTLINAVADKETYTRKNAAKILGETTITDEEYQTIESFARYKNSEIRSAVIELIKKRDEAGVQLSATRMVESKDENTRLAALDVIKWLCDSKPDKEFSDVLRAVEKIDSPSEREQILIGQLIGSDKKESVTKENGYGLYNTDAKLPLPDYTPDLSVVRDFFDIPYDEITDMYRALLKIIDDNSERQFVNHYGEERLLGNMGDLFYSYRDLPDNTEELEKSIVFSELWNKFYEETIRTPQRFFCFMLKINKIILPWKKDDYQEESLDNAMKNVIHILGKYVDYKLTKELGNEDERVTKSGFISLTNSVIRYLKKRYSIKIPVDVLQNFVGYMALNMSCEELWIDYKENNNGCVKKSGYLYFRDYDKKCFLDLDLIEDLTRELSSEIDEDFELNFSLLHTLYEKINKKGHLLNDNLSNFMFEHISVESYLKAYDMGIIDEDIFLKSMIELVGICTANKELSKYLHVDKEEKNDDAIYQSGRMFALKIIDKMLDVELQRGDSETVFSKSIKSIKKIYGLDIFVRILKALGNETLKYYYYSNDVSKKESLSYLLSVCYPTNDDTAAKLRQMLKGSKITAGRLAEIAMFAPQWIEIIEDYLGIEGLKSGCYYFMAHTAERIDDKRKAIIAKYTPLSIEELNGGCFDVKWFNEVYEKLGEKNFEMLYKSAKYSSAGNMHTRARKYADAALGKMDMDATKAQIIEKRNKDLLMAMAIIPSKNQSDILSRYEYIQQFLKESRQFGAQRRESEGAAVSYALKNLAVTAGYSDDTRLILSMETAIVHENKEYFENTRIGDYEVKINVDILGKASIVIDKNGKILKSVPAAIKKDEKFLSIKEFCEKLKQQYSRTVKMFELAMEESESFTFSELKKLSENPVTKAIVGNIVFIAADGEALCGFPVQDGISDEKGEVKSITDETLLRVAHPVDLYRLGVWADYQKLLLELGNNKGRCQPFRQVFRELYVKLLEESDKERSLMFAGNQIQTKRTVGALKNRRWIADYEDGLQKIYYKNNIIASIYAKADWFSPEDIEAPVLEGVFFTDRKTGNLMKISQIPDIIYSEIMRDVDLAVSVAHVGGVDPQTCHSTVEMRRVILEFNLGLFGITNVHIDKNHAIIEGTHGKYSIHLGSGVIHKMGGQMINVIAVSDKRTSKLFLPFIDEDPKTAEIMTKVLIFANDDKIKDPYIMEQIMR